MSRCGFWTALVLAVAAASAQAATPADLPLANMDHYAQTGRVTPTAEDRGAQRALHDYLRAYPALLPSQRQLTTIEEVSVDSPGAARSTRLESRSWNPHRAALAAACRASKRCDLLLADELRALGERISQELQRMRGADTPAQEAALLSAALSTSAAADLCDLAPDLEIYLPSPGVCPALGSGQYWDMAGYLWWQLEYNALANAFAGQAKAVRSWWKYVPPAGESSLAVPAFEQALLMDRVDIARMLFVSDPLRQAWEHWRKADTDDARAAALPPLRVAMARMAELSAQMGDDAASAAWLQGLGSLALPPGMSPGCDERQLVARAEVRRLHLAGRGPDAGALLGVLRQQGCGIAYVAAMTAQLALQRGDLALGARAADIGLAYCAETSRCYARNRDKLAELKAMASGDPRRLQALVAAWRRHLASGFLTGDERATALALAGVLAAGKDATLARDVYVALDDDVQRHLRDELIGAGALVVRQNLARYDDLRRRRVLAEFRTGRAFTTGALEILRAQGLLHRFRQKRWEQDFREDRDPALQAELDKGLASARSLRELLPALRQGDPVERALWQEFSRMGDATESLARDLYFSRLACKRGSAAWCELQPGAAGGALQSHEQSSSGSFFGHQDREALRFGEIYVSWVRVPGGYLESLVRPGQFAPPELRFLADTPAVTSALALYGKLLAAGAGASRGLRVATPPPVLDDQGLVLGRQPVWRQGDGRFVVADTAPPGSVRVKRLEELSDLLYAHFLLPHRRAWQDADTLVLSPDADLALLPFETLTYRGAPILEMIDIHYVQSLGVHAEIRARMKDRALADTLLTVADPLYVSGVDNIEWAPLPGTRLESDRVAELYPHHRRLLGGEAARAGVLALNESKALRDFGVLHFATHGYADTTRSALVLSNREGAATSYLADDDVSLFSLDSDLVLLSACDTGVGRNVGGEGVVGLPYAFFMAGNRNTLMSLWPVDDAGTAAFIPAFMARVRGGQDMVAALNDTKRAFQRGEYGPALRDPRIWAAFVLYGAANPPASPAGG